jgi:hypothetical protein
MHARTCDDHAASLWLDDQVDGPGWHQRRQRLLQRLPTVMA